MLRHAMGVLFFIAAFFALGSIYNAVADFNHYWLQGLLGLAAAGAAVLIYRRWFAEWFYIGGGK